MKKSFCISIFFLVFSTSIFANVGIKGVERFEDFRNMRVIETISSKEIKAFSKNDIVNAMVFADSWKIFADNKKSFEKNFKYTVDLITINIQKYKYILVCLREQNGFVRDRYYILNVFSDIKSARNYRDNIFQKFDSYCDFALNNTVMQLFLNIVPNAESTKKYNYYIMGWYYGNSYFTMLCIL